MPKMTLMWITLIMAAVVTVSSLRTCEDPEDPITFYDECLHKILSLCDRGWHLRACTIDVTENNRCEPATNGYITSYNYCNESNPWTECGPGETEILAPTPESDRKCGPISVTSAVSPSQSPSQCPLCQCTITCPDCPECSTPGTQMISSDTVENTTSGVSYSETVTVPELNVTAEQPDACPSLQIDLERWKTKTNVLTVLLIFLFVVVMVLVVIIYRQRETAKLRNRPDPENNQCPDGVNFNKANGKVSGRMFGSGSNGCVNKVHLPVDVSNKSLNISSEGSDAQNGISSLVENSSKPIAAPIEVDVHNAPVGSGKRPDVADNTKSEPPKSLRVNNKPIVKRDYDINGGTPSTQPLLDSSTSFSEAMNSETPTDVYKRSVEAATFSDHVGDNAEALKGTPPNSNALHEAPTAPYRDSPPKVSFSTAFAKAEGPCETTKLCTEAHVDFVKDNIDIKTHMDFFGKLGLSKKDYADTMYDYKAEKTREQIRHVIIDDFINKEDNPSIDRLLNALNKSGNKNVSREFRDIFHVTSSEACST